MIITRLIIGSHSFYNITTISSSSLTVCDIINESPRSHAILFIVCFEQSSKNAGIIERIMGIILSINTFGGIAKKGRRIVV